MTGCIWWRKTANLIGKQRLGDEGAKDERHSKDMSLVPTSSNWALVS